jgi:hypothetical protein
MVLGISSCVLGHVFGVVIACIPSEEVSHGGCQV